MENTKRPGAFLLPDFTGESTFFSVIAVLSGCLNMRWFRRQKILDEKGRWSTDDIR